MKKPSFHAIMGRLLFREIFRNWSQSLAIVAIGAIAMTLFVGLQANSASLSSRVEEMSQLSHPADIYVTTDPHSLKADDDSKFILDTLEEGDYLESRFYGYCAIEGKSSMLAVSPNLPTLSTPYDVKKLSTLTPSDYFFIDEATIAEAKLLNPDYNPLGSKVSITFDLSSMELSDAMLGVLDAFLLNGKENPFRAGALTLTSEVNGTMKHPENTTKASPIPFLAMMSSRRFKSTVVSALQDAFTPLGVNLILRQGFYETLGWGDGTIDGGTATFPKPNQYLIHLANPNTANAKKQAISKAYERKIENNLYLIQTLRETSFMSTLADEVSQAEKLTMVFPVVFLVVGILVILTTFRQDILKRREEIGTLKSLGVTKARIHGLFLSQTLSLVGLACVIGASVGPFLLPFIMSKKYDILFTLPGRSYVFPVWPAVIAMASFIAVALLVTFAITFKEIALRPVKSMRPRTMKVHRKFLKSSAKRQGPIALSAKMAGRNLLYDPIKAFMVIIGMMGCTALLVCGFGIDDTLNYDITTDPYVNSSSQVIANFSSAQKQATLDLDLGNLKTPEGVNAISSYQPYERNNLEFRAGETTMASYLFVLGKPTSFDGAPSPEHLVGEFPKDKVLMSAKVADTLHVKAGDTVSFYFNGQYVDAPIHRVYEAMVGNGVIFHGDSPLLSIPYESYASAWINAPSAVSESACRDAVMGLGYIALADTQTEWHTRINNMISSISTMTTAVKVFAILLALVVIYNLGLLNFRERTREIATLKALGFHTVEIGAGLLLETLSMTLIGILGGLAVGFPFMKLVLMINQIEVIQYIYMIYPLTYVLAALGSFLAAFAVNAGLTGLIRRVKSVEALKSVE